MKKHNMAKKLEIGHARFWFFLSYYCKIKFLNQISLISKIKKFVYLVRKLKVGLNSQNQEIFMIFKQNFLNILVYIFS